MAGADIRRPVKTAAAWLPESSAAFPCAGPSSAISGALPSAPGRPARCRSNRAAVAPIRSARLTKSAARNGFPPSTGRSRPASAAVFRAEHPIRQCAQHRRGGALGDAELAAWIGDLSRVVGGCLSHIVHLPESNPAADNDIASGGYRWALRTICLDRLRLAARGQRRGRHQQEQDDPRLGASPSLSSAVRGDHGRHFSRRSCARSDHLVPEAQIRWPTPLPR